MLKRNVMLLCCLVFLLIFDGCGKRGDVMQEIDKDKLKLTEQIFEIDLPEEGNLLYYESTLEEENLGNIYVELELDKSCYKDICKQLEENYHLEESEKKLDEMEKFQTSKEELSEIYIAMDSLRRDAEISINEMPLTQYYYVYITKVKKGVFRLIFVAEGC